MNTSNKLLMGLLVIVLLFITVMLVTARVYVKEREPNQEIVTPPSPDAPAVPDAPAPPAVE